MVGNLLANVRVHTPADSPLEVVARADGSEAELRVVDHGRGIDEAVGSSVFDRFYREDPGRSRDHGGTGLGLSIASALVQAHDGRIWHEATAGGGATFVVRLPLGAWSPRPRRRDRRPRRLAVDNAPLGAIAAHSKLTAGTRVAFSRPGQRVANSTRRARHGAHPGGPREAQQDVRHPGRGPARGPGGRSGARQHRFFADRPADRRSCRPRNRRRPGASGAPKREFKDEALTSVLDDLVAKGTITAAQKQAIVDGLQAEREQRIADAKARMEALRAQAAKVKEFLADGQITQAELDQLPADSPLRNLSNLMDDGKITTEELRRSDAAFLGNGGFRGFGRGHGFGCGPRPRQGTAPSRPPPSPSSGS